MSCSVIFKDNEKLFLKPVLFFFSLSPRDTQVQQVMKEEQGNDGVKGGETHYVNNKSKLEAAAKNRAKQLQTSHTTW